MNKKMIKTSVHLSELACAYVLYLHIPHLSVVALPFAHLRWKGQPRSNIDTIDMFAKTAREISSQVDKQRFMNPVYPSSVGADSPE